jgi:molybdenum cofactor cytidylyltransferase
MGRPKLLLPLPGGTVLSRVVAAIRATPVTDVLVVVGPQAADVAGAAAQAGASVLRLEEQTPDMRATCERGLDWLDERHQPEPEDALLVVPADHPTLDVEVIRALLDVAVHDRAASIVVPAYQGRRGHPVLIRWRHAAELRALPADEGWNRFIRRQLHSTRAVDWASAEVLRDLDTPEDYRRLQDELGG